MAFEQMCLVCLASLIGFSYGLDVPTFEDLTRHYPGYPSYGGRLHDNALRLLYGLGRSRGDSSALRLSVSLNLLGGPHAVDSDLQLLKDGDIKTVKSRGEYFILDSATMGPYLENKYRTPQIIQAKNNDDPQDIILPLLGKRGIVRVAKYGYKTADARVGLWDCDHFYQTRDWSLHRHLIAVEFWQSPDSPCSTTSS